MDGLDRAIDERNRSRVEERQRAAAEPSASRRHPLGARNPRAFSHLVEISGTESDLDVNYLQFVARRQVAGSVGAALVVAAVAALDIARVIIEAVPLERARAIQSSLSEEINRATTNGRRKSTLAGHPAADAVRIG